MRIRIFSGRTRSQGLSEILINTFEPLTNQQKDGDSPIQNIIMSLKEQCRKRITNGLRNFVTLDNYSAVEMDYLQIDTLSVKQFTKKSKGVNGKSHTFTTET